MKIFGAITVYQDKIKTSGKTRRFYKINKEKTRNIFVSLTHHKSATKNLDLKSPVSYRCVLTIER